MQQGPLVIIGSGLAGYSVVREFRKLNSVSPVILISADHAGFYSKPMLSNALSMGKTPDMLVISNAQQMEEQHQITVRPNIHVQAINIDKKLLQLSNGEGLAYGKLVLALGADQIHLSLQGDAVADIMSINNLDDYRRFRSVLDGKKRVSIIGAGLIGCEFANDLVGEGYQVNVIDISSWPLGRFLPAVAGAYLRKKLEAAGVTFSLDAMTQQVDQEGDHLRLTMANGDCLESDVILSAVGLRPRTKLAQGAGIPVNQGIMVSELLQTPFSDIFALGDCAEVRGKVLPFIMPITHASRALAATLSGDPTPVSYPAMPVLVKTPACPTVVSPPNAGAQGEWEVDENEEGVKALFRDNAGNLLGFALLGDAIKDKNALVTQLPPVL